MTSLWGLLYVEDAGVVSQSSEQLRKMMGVIVVVCAAFGLNVSETKTDSCVYAQRECRSPPPYSACRGSRPDVQPNEQVRISRGQRHSQCRPIHRCRPAHTQRMVQLLEEYPRALPSSSKSGCYETSYSRQRSTAASRGTRARATTTGCADPTIAS